MTTTTNITSDKSSAFRIRRPLITTSGLVSDVDPIVKKHLEELNTLLGKAVFEREEGRRKGQAAGVGGLGMSVPDQADIGKQEPYVAKDESSRRRPRNGQGRVRPDVRELLSRPLTPKRIPANDWAEVSILHELDSLDAGEDKLTLGDYIDATPELARLNYAFDMHIEARWHTLDENTQAVLEGHRAIADYLLVYAYHVMEVTDPHGVLNFLITNSAGLKSVANYAAVTAARELIDRKQLAVPEINDDNSKVVERLQDANLPLSEASFTPAVDALVGDIIFNSREAKVLDEVLKEIGPIPVRIRGAVIRAMKRSEIPITEQNGRFFLPPLINQISSQLAAAEPVERELATPDTEFDVTYLEDEKSRIQVSESAVKCAAQLYYGMILGDELEVFPAVNYFTHKYLIRGAMEIESPRLRDDLQLYVFNGKFIDLKTKEIVDRTRPAERQMFYRQVFNYGGGQITEDVITNREFARLWKVLMLESARYIERAQLSPHPHSFVSRQGVTQAVEDLQYNLSTHCTGMASVITPLIYGELEFVIKRIFMHDEVLRKVVPSGGTWWRVVEILHLAMKNHRPKSTVLHNKAKLGHAIIRSIAEYNSPSTFEDDAAFSQFISHVDAFITTQSILQDHLTDDLKKHNEEDDAEAEPGVTSPESAGEPAAAGAGAAGDEWDF